MAVESPEAQLFLDISDRLQQLVPELRHVDTELGQLENYELKPPVTFPCALIDIDEIEYTDLPSEQRQIGEGLVIIRIGNPAWSPTSGIVPTGVREKGLSYFEHEHKVFKALHGWVPPGCNKLLRRKTKTEKRNDAIRVRIMAFAVVNKSSGAVKARTVKATPEPAIGNQR